MSQVKEDKKDQCRDGPKLETAAEAWVVKQKLEITREERIMLPGS